MIKQVIVARKDLKMKPGKLAAQVAHASLACILNCKVGVPEQKDFTNTFYNEFAFTADELKWLTEDTLSKFTKIVLKVNSEEELLDIYKIAKDKGINCSLIKDAGNTVFTEPTYTCVGLGPVRSSELDDITGGLKLY